MPRGRWYLLNPASPEKPDQWVQGLEKIAQQLAGWERGAFRCLWDWVRDTFMGTRGKQVRAYAEAFQQTLIRYVRPLPPEAKRLLARHHTALVVAPDLGGVAKLWKSFGYKTTPPTAFVHYEKDIEGSPLSFLVLDGSGGRDLRFVHLHELAHMVDYDPVSRRRITKTQEWLQLSRREKNLALRSSWEDPGKPAPEKFQREAFAHALAWCWFHPETAKAQTPELYSFFRKRGLVR